MNEPRIRPWDAPVVRALDAVEELPGFDPDHVEWDTFRFYGTDAYVMDAAAIYASPPTGRGYVRFAATSDGATVTGPGPRDLTPGDVARALAVPIESAEAAVAALGPALQAALAAFNAAHDPASRSCTRSSPARTMPTSVHPSGRAIHPPPIIDR